MDKRPPNPRRLSRKLFTKKPEIKPYEGWNVPKYALGETTKFQPLRSDIGKIEVKPGGDFATYDLFLIGVRKGFIPDMMEFTRKKKEPKYDDYKRWRSNNLGRDEQRIRQGATTDMKWIKADKDDPEAKDYGSGPEKLVREHFKGDDFLRDAPLLKHEIKEAIKDKEEELERPLTKKEQLEIKKSLFAEDRKEGKGEAFSLMEEERKEKATELHEAREGMTRAQQRKLGRVIREGKTGPLTRTLKENYKEDEKRNTYESYEYEPVRYDYRKNKGTLTYMYGFDEKSKDMIGEREELREEYDKDLTAMAELDRKYKALREENKALLKDFISKDKIKELTKKGFIDETHPSYIEEQKGKAIEFQGPIEEVRKWIEFPYGGKVRKDPKTGKNVGFDEFNINKRKYHAYLKKQGLRPPSKIDKSEYYVENPKYDKTADKQFLGLYGVSGTPYKDKWGWDKSLVSDYEALKDGVIERRRLFDTEDDRDPQRHNYEYTNKYEKHEWENVDKHPLMGKEYSYIPAVYNVMLSPEQRKEFLRNADRITKLKTSYKGVREGMKEKKKEYKSLGKTLEDFPSQKLFSHSVSFDTKEGMDKAIAEMREKTKDYGLIDPKRSHDVPWYQQDDKKLKRFFTKPKEKSYGKDKKSRYWDTDRSKDSFNRFNKGVRERMTTDFKGTNPLFSEDARRGHSGNIEGVNQFLENAGILKFDYGDNKTAFSKKMPKPTFEYEGKKYLTEKEIDKLDNIERVPMGEDRGAVALIEGSYEGRKTEYASKGQLFADHRVDKYYRDEEGKIRKRRYIGKRTQRIKKVKRIRRLDRDVMNNPNFSLNVARGKGRRVFHMEEGEKKGWKEVGINKYAKQAQNWKALDVDTTPAKDLQLRGIRDRRTHGARLIGRGGNPRRMDRSKEYKSARSEALIQMRINESAGVRDAKSKAEKDIKQIRISEAQKALNLKLAKETAEKTTEALKAKNAGITHSYNVNVRNQQASTLLGSNPDELNKLLKKGGGLALVKAMVRKGEISDVSTIGQLNVSVKQKDNLMRLLNEGGTYVEGQEYFFRMLDDFGQTKVQRGYLNKGGDRKDNLELMYIQTLPDGTSQTQRYIVPKDNILKPDDHTSTTSSGKRQSKTEPRQLSQFELDLFGEEEGTELPQDVSHFGVPIQQDPKTGVKSLVKTKGAGIADPSPVVGGSILQTLQQGGDFDTMGADLQLELDEEHSTTSEEGFEFGGDAPTEFVGAPKPEPEPQYEEDKPPTPYGVKPYPFAKQPTIDDELDLGMGQQIAEELGAGMPDKPAGTEEMIKALEVAHDEPIEGEEGEPPKLLDPADILEAQQLQQKGKEGPLKEGIVRSPTPPKEEPKPKKKVQIKEEVAELFQQKDRGLEMNEVGPGWTANENEVPEAVLGEDWDMRAKGLVSRFAEGGSQHVPKGHIAIWTTKWAPRDNQTILLVNEADIYYLMRGLRGVGIRNDSGKSNPISDASLKSFYRKILEGIRSGRKEIAFNNKQLLRGLDMIDPYESESD